MSNEFKPNIYPIMYWGLAFGALMGVLLFIIELLAAYITYAWAPFFLIGVVYGGYRNYLSQKKAWSNASGIAPTRLSPLDEFKEAVRDVTTATQELMSQQAKSVQSETQQPQKEATEQEIIESQKEVPAEDNQDTP